MYILKINILIVKILYYVFIKAVLCQLTETDQLSKLGYLCFKKDFFFLNL